MARIDKYEPKAGGFRAPLAGAWTGSEDPIGVGLDTNGRVVAGSGTTGIIGVLCKPDDAVARSIVDIMTNGELVEFDGDAGSSYTADTTTGEIDATAAGAGQVSVGFTVEAERLVVRMGSGASAGGSVSGGQTSIVALTDNSGGTANNTIALLPVLTDTPASADALRDDIVNNFVPVLKDSIADLAGKINTIITTLDNAGITA